MTKIKIAIVFACFVVLTLAKCSADDTISPPHGEIVGDDSLHQDTVYHSSASSNGEFAISSTEASSQDQQISQSNNSSMNGQSSELISSSEASSIAILPSSQAMLSSQVAVSSQQSSIEPENSWVNEGEMLMLSLVNAARAEVGSPALQLDSALSLAARAKANDLDSTGVLSHTSETFGGGPAQLLAIFGITSRNWGENIANNRSVEGAFNAWMNSEGHRNNILNPSFTHMGYANSGRFHAQIFIQRR